MCMIAVHIFWAGDRTGQQTPTNKHTNSPSSQNSTAHNKIKIYNLHFSSASGASHPHHTQPIQYKTKWVVSVHRPHDIDTHKHSLLVSVCE